MPLRKNRIFDNFATPLFPPSAHCSQGSSDYHLNHKKMTTQEAVDTAKKYEIMLMLSGELSEEAVDKALEHIKTQIAEREGSVFYEDKWGRRDLAYRVARQSNAHFVILNILLDSEHVKEIDQSLRLDNHVLRHLLQQVPSAYKVQKFPEKIEEELTEEIMNKPQKKERKITRPVPTEEPVTVKEPEAVEVTSSAEPEDDGETEEEKSRKKLDEVEEKLRDIISDKDLNL